MLTKQWPNSFLCSLWLYIILVPGGSCYQQFMHFICWTLYAFSLCMGLPCVCLCNCLWCYACVLVPVPFLCVCVQGGVTIDLELLLPKEAKMLTETSPSLHYNVFLYKLPKSPKKSPVLRRPPGRSVQGRPLSQLCPRRSSEPSYSPISTRSLPGVLSGSSSPHLGTAYTPWHQCKLQHWLLYN